MRELLCSHRRKKKTPKLCRAPAHYHYWKPSAVGDGLRSFIRFFRCKRHELERVPDYFHAETVEEFVLRVLEKKTALRWSLSLKKGSLLTSDSSWPRRLQEEKEFYQLKSEVTFLWGGQS